MSEGAGGLRLKVHGLDCAEEVASLRREVGPVVGGEDRLSFDVLGGTMTVEAPTPAGAIIAAVARTGMRAEVVRESRPANGLQLHDDRRERNLLTLLSGLFAIAGFTTHALLAGGPLQALGREGLGHSHAVPLVAISLYALGIVGGMRFVIRKAWHSAVRLRPDMNLLMTVAVLGAIALGEWFEAASVAFLFALSLALEAWSVGRARRAVAALFDLSPQSARLKLPTGEESRPIETVPVGSIFILQPGERVPLDGVVVAGSSAINQAPITGESVPVLKEPGTDVFAGSINGDGALEVRTTRPAGDTTLAKIIRLVRDAQSKRGNAEQWVDRFARRYTPTVIVLALAFALVPPLLSMGSWSVWFYRSLVLLVIACPCALVISTPVSIVAALASAARAGVLVKGGLFLEIPARLKAIAFDKTGTVTEGRMEVASVVPLNGHTEYELIERAVALEGRSTHPLARAIVAYAHEKGIHSTPADAVVLLPGKGATGRIDGREFWLGSHRYLEERGQEETAVHELIGRLSGYGSSVVVVGNERHLCGVIALADRPRPQTQQVLEDLRQLGLERLTLLTGDNQGTADAVGRAFRFDEVRAELLPHDKVKAVSEMVARYGTVAMIGDGVNDAPAMATATLGIAMGAAGSDAAIETADVALMSDDLSRLPWLIGHSRRTVAIMRENITFALLVKLVFVVLAFAGRATLWSAIAADMGASLVVILNALRLLRTDSTNPAPTA
ncbi:MAG: metal-transporting ATPase [Candidatus Eisenbacteria bacterium RBG_16_71_46]|nr:MAG: metal-transporting ATPase [Candidatus Eisenbacteria bacterium RBG_16_71_46]OGF24310.1 MAG: metal-transporting ATPase [Candidatus Eisenbacteria bacterium RBG_19FT_COMBO_70_11]